MKQGFIKVAAVTVDIRVADVWHNCKEICKHMKEAEKAGAKIIVFPELCLTGYTCSDLFTQDILLKEVRRALAKVADLYLLGFHLQLMESFIMLRPH